MLATYHERDLLSALGPSARVGSYDTLPVIECLPFLQAVQPHHSTWNEVLLMLGKIFDRRHVVTDFC